MLYTENEPCDLFIYLFILEDAWSAQHSVSHEASELEKTAVPRLLGLIDCSHCPLHAIMQQEVTPHMRTQSVYVSRINLPQQLIKYYYSLKIGNPDLR